MIWAPAVSLDISGGAKLANISTRGFVNTGDNAMIGGFIVRGQGSRVIVRAIGPSLSAPGIQGALQDLVLELRDGSGSLILANDDWRSTQEQEIIATGGSPTDEHPRLRVADPGRFADIVSGRGKNTTIGRTLLHVTLVPRMSSGRVSAVLVFRGRGLELVRARGRRPPPSAGCPSRK